MTGVATSSAPMIPRYAQPSCWVRSPYPAAVLPSDTKEAAVNQRLANVEAENRRLRRELEDAEDKLEAITSIERSIRQQDQ